MDRSLPDSLPIISFHWRTITNREETMKNITVTVHDETYLQARVWAAWHGTSVSALVRQFLESLDESPSLGFDLPASTSDDSGTPLPPYIL